MTRNQKIALGCGGAGCLGLIVVGIAVGVFFYFYNSATPRRYTDSNYNSIRTSNINMNSNRNSNLNRNSNTNESSDSTDSSSSASSLSDDEKHRLFQAASITRDFELQRRVWVKIGIVEEDFSQGDKFAEFAAAHVGWAVRNYQWIAGMDSPEKARAYINEHLP